nr:MAG TPA: hypothetical protein [Caudoviricetes sp.]DAZ44008.1 MAG TPA: hypothetical protein [Caudoviricetes sp.]
MKEKGNVEMNDIEKKLEALKVEFLGKLEELKKEAEMQKKQEEWKFGEKYFYISQTGRVIQDTFTEHRIDTARKNFGNFFSTSVRAEQVAKKIRLLLQLEQLHDQLCPDYEPDWDGTAKFLVAFDHTDGKMQAFFDRSSGESTLVYFRDAVTAMEAADILNSELEESE